MAVNTNDCEHGFPQFLCVRCEGSDRSGPVASSTSLPGAAGSDSEEQIKIADHVIFDTIAAAEEVHDPLDGLVEKTAGDPGAPFTPDVMAALAALKKDDRAAFEALRARLKSAGCRVTALDGAIAEESGDVGGRGPTQADILVGLAQTAEPFHAPDGTGFADLDVNGHRETWPIRSKGFRRWLTRRFYEETGGAPSSEALQSALNVIEAKAHFDGPEREVHIRIGGFEGRLYLDLADKTWRAVEIDATGWRVIENPPVRFRRAAGMKPLPVPVTGGSIEALRPFLNVKSDNDFVLVVAWALAVLRNRGPYPVMVLSGEQGSAKSTLLAILRSLLDPNTAPLRALPREDRDLFIAASNGHVLAFDNVSGLPAWISDTLCRLATGGGFAVRQLYTDDDEILFDATRPVILNGIEEIVTRPDLADRAVFLTLQPIPEEHRRSGAGIMGRVRGRATAHPWCAARRGGGGPQAVARDTAGEAAPHGGFRAVGDGLRDRRCGPPAPSRRPIPAIATRRSRVSSTPIRLPLPCGLSWRSRRLSRQQSRRLRRCRRGRCGRCGRELPRNFWAPLSRWWGSASPSRRTGLIALGHCRAGCGGLRPSCARSASISPSRRKKAGRGRGPSPSPALFPRQKSRGNLRPHRPNRPPIREMPIPAMVSRLSRARTQNCDADANPRRADGSGQGDDQTVRGNSLENNALDAADGADANPPPQSSPEKTVKPGWSTRL